MKTKYLIIITVLLSTIFFQSCSDFLDEKNESDPVTADYYKTNEGFNSLVIAVYAQWKEIYGQSLPWFFWCGTDIYTTGNSEEPEDLMVYSTLNPRSEAIDKHYRICFDIIQKVNMGLYFSEITDQSNPDLNARIGELQFFRAFAYFQLVQDYGGVPIVTDYLQEMQQSFDRASAEALYEQIITDLEDAIDNLPDDAYSNVKRLVKRSAQHLLSKVYLTKGYEDFGTLEDYKTAAKIADETIGGQELNLTFEKLWEPGNEFNEEVLFSIQYSPEMSAPDPEDLGSNQSSQIGGGSYLGSNDPLVIYKNQTCMPSRYGYSLFNEKNDVRRDVTFMTTQYEKYLHYWTLPANERKIQYFFEPPWFSRQDSIDYMENLGVADTVVGFKYKTWAPGYNSYTTDDFGGDPSNNMICKKFDDPTGGYYRNSSTRDIVLFRLGETYLIAAEAYSHFDKATGMSRYNKVRKRSNASEMTNSGELTILAILEERGRELYGEYKRWYDLKRTGMLETQVVEYNAHVDPGNFDGFNGHKKFLRPIPQSAIDLNKNKNFPQNPAYVP